MTFSQEIHVHFMRKVKKGLDILGNTSSGNTRVTKLKYEN